MHFKIISSETIDENPWWKYKHDKYLSSSGEEGDYYYGESSGAAMVVPVLDDGRLVLINQYRYLSDRFNVEFPCGGMHAHESPAVAAERELLEETGFKVNELVNIGSFESSRTFLKDRIHVFVATNVEKTIPQNLEKTEVIEVIYRRIDEFDDMIKRGEIQDGQTLATWAMVRNYLANIK